MKLRTCGMTDVRRGLTAVVEGAINTSQITKIIDSKATQSNKKSAMVIGEDLFNILISINNKYGFKPSIENNEGVWEISYDDFLFHGIGDTYDEAVENLLEIVDATLDDYFDQDEFKLNMQFSNTKALLPAYLQLATCSDRKCKIGVLGLER